MASSSKAINSFQVAVILEKANLGNIDVLAEQVDLAKLTRLINQYFTPEKTNAGNTVTITPGTAQTTFTSGA